MDSTHFRIFRTNGSYLRDLPPVERYQERIRFFRVGECIRLMYNTIRLSGEHDELNYLMRKVFLRMRYILFESFSEQFSTGSAFVKSDIVEAAAYDDEENNEAYDDQEAAAAAVEADAGEAREAGESKLSQPVEDKIEDDYVVVASSTEPAAPAAAAEDAAPVAPQSEAEAMYGKKKPKKKKKKKKEYVA